MPTMLNAAGGSVLRFIEEARCCAGNECGFAAMLTAFAVLLTIREAVTGAGPPDAMLFAGFIPRMSAKATWFCKSGPPAVDSDISTALVKLRNALAHESSMPDDVKMANSTAELATVRNNWPHAIIICVLEFVNDVSDTAHDLIAAFPYSVMDPSQPGRNLAMPRDVAERTVFPDGTSASSIR